ncbi:hypothetical protein C8Q78DRAFT_416587 [Trametes maxima]|nr:hypothetical protein C8Q78DRAFT_416587 [Trametes maxima]
MRRIETWLAIMRSPPSSPSRPSPTPFPHHCYMLPPNFIDFHVGPRGSSRDWSPSVSRSCTEYQLRHIGDKTSNFTVTQAGEQVYDVVRTDGNSILRGADRELIADAKQDKFYAGSWVISVHTTPSQPDKQSETMQLRWDSVTNPYWVTIYRDCCWRWRCQNVGPSGKEMTEGSVDYGIQMTYPTHWTAECSIPIENHKPTGLPCTAPSRIQG